MEAVRTAAVVVGLSVGIVLGLVVGLRYYDRMLRGETLLRRIRYAPVLLAVILVEFVLVVEWRCALDLLDPSECLF